MSTGTIVTNESPAQGWSDGLPIVVETTAILDKFLACAGLAADHDLGRGVRAGDAAMHAVRAGCLPEYMPVVVAALEAILDPAFHIEHLGSALSTWPVFVVNGPITRELELYSGVYVMSSGRKANATIGRAISLTVGNCLSGLISGHTSTFGNAARMAGMVIAEK